MGWKNTSAQKQGCWRRKGPFQAQGAASSSTRPGWAGYPDAPFECPQGHQGRWPCLCLLQDSDEWRDRQWWQEACKHTHSEHLKGNCSGFPGQQHWWGLLLPVHKHQTSHTWYTHHPGIEFKCRSGAGPENFSNTFPDDGHATGPRTTVWVARLCCTRGRTTSEEANCSPPPPPLGWWRSSQLPFSNPKHGAHWGDFKNIEAKLPPRESLS